MPRPSNGDILNLIETGKKALKGVSDIFDETVKEFSEVLDKSVSKDDDKIPDHLLYRRRAAEQAAQQARETTGTPKGTFRVTATVTDTIVASNRMEAYTILADKLRDAGFFVSK